MIRPMLQRHLFVCVLALCASGAQAQRTPEQNAFDVCTDAAAKALRHSADVEKVLFSTEGNQVRTEGGTVEIDGPGTLMLRSGAQRPLHWRCSYRVQDGSVSALAARVEQGRWQDLGTSGPSAAIGGGGVHGPMQTTIAANRCRSAVMAELFRNNPSAVMFEVDVGTQVGKPDGTRYPVHGQARVRQNAGNVQTQKWQCSFDARDGNVQGVQLN